MNQRIDELEKKVGLILPQQYRTFLENYPQWLAQHKYSDDPKFGGPSDFELLSDLKQIAKLNRCWRKLWAESDYAEIPFPKSYLLIGEDGCGNIFAIDTQSTGKETVLEFDHELMQWESCADSIGDFANKLVKTS